MKLILDPKEFEHLPDISFYNNNYYKNRETGTIVFEKCDECYETNYYTDVTDNKNEYFLGSCSCSNGEGLDYNSPLEIEFKIKYT